ncbi:ABC transporter permease [Nocardioides sp. InS609-2]|uniref:ABC transporter permease n=1 Tax=Nocardioides sp. InS609-2 TaxID=2760705 RepID=UPI0020BF8CE4|nr:ABC transporter permease [Nocardioides sp. InS609-2]
MKVVLLASLRTHTRRYVAAALAVAIGVAFIITTAALTSSARSGMLAGIKAPYAGADVVVTNLSSEAAVEIRDGAADTGADAAVIGWTRQSVARDGVRIVDETDVGELSTTPALRWQELDSGRFATGPGEAVVDVNDAKKGDVKVGDRLTIGSDNDKIEVDVVGLVDSPSITSAASIYLTWTDLQPWAETIYVDSIAWASSGSVAEQTRQIEGITRDVSVLSVDDFVEERQIEANQGVNVLATLLLLFAAIALFVSVLVIANTFSILFAQRQRDFALLRCVGATRRQVLRSIRAEALVLGVVSSAVGIAAGAGLGYGLVAVARSKFSSAAMGSVDIGLHWYVGAAAVGLLVTTVAAWLPTRRAVRVDPLVALRPDSGIDVRTNAGRWRIAAGVLVGAVGVALLAMAVAMQSPVVMVAGGSATFVGLLMLGPVIVPGLIRAVGPLTGRVAGMPGRLATSNAVRNPRRTAATTASLLIGVTLTTAVLIGMASSRSALGAEMDTQHPLDAALTSTGKAIPGSVLTQVEGLESVKTAIPVQGTAARVVGAGAVALLGAPDSNAVTRGDAPLAPAGPGEIYLPWDVRGPEQYEGDTVTVRVGEQTAELTIVGGEGWGQAAIVAPDTLARLAPDAALTAIWVRATDGADADDFGGDLDALGAPVGAELVNGLADRSWVDLQLDVLTGTVVGLLAVAVVIALIGIANTLGLSVIERGRENSLLCALGLTRRQLRATLAVESVLLSVVATVLGGVIGTVFAWVAVRAMVEPVIADAPFVLPWLQLAVVVLVAGAAGLLAGVLPARRAARTAPAAGLATD